MCTVPPVIKSFLLKSENTWCPLIQMVTTSLLVATFSTNAILQFTNYLNFAIPFTIIFLLTVSLGDYRMITKLFMSIMTGQVILIALKLDRQIEITWDIVLFPTFATYIVSICLTEVMFFCSSLVLIMFLVTLFKGTSEHRYRKHGLGYLVVSLCSLSIILCLLYITFR